MNESAGIAIRTNDLSRKGREIGRKEKVLTARIESLNEEFESAKEELNRASIEEELRKEILEINRLTISKKRLEDNSHAKLKNKTK